MTIPTILQSFCFADKTVQAYIPSAEWLQQQFENHEMKAAPYWAQVWPAAKALCEVLAAEPELVNGKTVLEIAAGLGLPSLLAAQFAKDVTATDYIPDAVEIMKRSAAHNQFSAMHCLVMDWNDMDKKLQPDVLLLSDINYDPVSFDTLQALLSDFIRKGTVVLLSTPQRLVAKPFMDRLETWCIRKENIEVKHGNEIVFASVWLLAKNKD